MSKGLVYFVDDIDTSFVYKDIQMLSKMYDEVRLFSTEKIENTSQLPSNVYVNDTYLDWKNYSPMNVMLKHGMVLFAIYLKESWTLKKLLPLKKSLAVLSSNFFKAVSFKAAFGKEVDIKHEWTYTAFWFYDCIYLARLKQLGNIQQVYVRAHGGDLFEERSSLRDNVLFRNYQLSHLDKVFSVSKVGTDYLKNKYPNFKHKIETLYLGSVHHEDINPWNDKSYTIVSCANIRDVKRIHLIAEALQKSTIQLKWYHIGDENLQAKNDDSIERYLNAKSALKLNSNIEYLAMGIMDNSEVMSFYRETPIHLFLSVSESEGIPVSMMEAISFGIPVISTDVGGCKEIVVQRTGELIAEDFKIEELIDKIERFRDSEKNSEKFRLEVKRFWSENFDELMQEEKIRRFLKI